MASSQCTWLTALQDVQWSAQDENQLIGRVHRQGQTKQVIVYRLKALNSPDVKISDLSKIKGNLHENMLKKQVDLGEVLSPLPSTMCSLRSREPHRPAVHAGQRER